MAHAAHEDFCKNSSLPTDRADEQQRDRGLVPHLGNCASKKKVGHKAMPVRGHRNQIVGGRGFHFACCSGLSQKSLCHICIP